MNEWKHYRLKDICIYIGSGTTPKSSNEKYYTNGIHNWINTGDLNNAIVSSCKQHISDDALKDYPTLRCYPNGTIIEAMYGATIGKVGMLSMDAFVNQACCAMVINEKIAFPKFILYYLIHYKDLLIRESFGGTQPNVNQFKVSNIGITIPHITFQQAIVSYLDTKLSEIDHQVSLLTSKRDAYLRLKKSIINRAVTKGLNPNAAMKDSGIDWIGEVPEGWEVKRIKEIGNLRLGKMLTEKPIPGFHQRPYLKSKNIDWLNLKLDSVEEMYFSDSELTSLRLNKHDLVISEGGEVGKTAIWENEIQECYIQNSVHKLTFGHECNPRYYLYLFYILGHMGYFKSIVNLVSIMHLTYEKLRRIEIPVPELEEQNRIATYLDDKCSKIDLIISNLDKQISKYGDLKRSLIDEVITGKRAV